MAHSSSVSGSGLSARTTHRYVNSQGQTIRITDALGNATDYANDAAGNQTRVSGPGGIAETLWPTERRARTSSHCC